MNRVHLRIRHFRRLVAAILPIIVAFAPYQIVQSEEPDTSKFNSAAQAAAEFKALATSSQTSDAIRIASRILGQGTEYAAETGESLVEPLMKHAMVRQQAGENLQAEQAVELVIELIERNGGVFDPGLVEPWGGFRCSLSRSRRGDRPNPGPAPPRLRCVPVPGAVRGGLIRWLRTRRW